MKQLLLRFGSGERIENEEIEMRRSNGESVWVSWTLHAVRNERGELVESRSIAIDITERKEADEALRESEHRLANILDISSDAIISTDEGQRIFVFNRGAEEIFGYSASEVLGKPLDMLLPRRFTTAHRRHVQSFSTSTLAVKPMTDRARRGSSETAGRRAGAIQLRPAPDYLRGVSRPPGALEDGEQLHPAVGQTL